MAENWGSASARASLREKESGVRKFAASSLKHSWPYFRELILKLCDLHGFNIYASA